LTENKNVGIAIKSCPAAVPCRKGDGRFFDFHTTGVVNLRRPLQVDRWTVYSTWLGDGDNYDHGTNNRLTTDGLTSATNAYPAHHANQWEIRSHKATPVRARALF